MSQRSRIKRHLESGKKISPLQALREYGCMRLASRISELRREGMPITVETHKKGYAVYRLDLQEWEDAKLGQRRLALQS